MTPVHLWTNGGKRVFALRYVSADHKSYGGFQWPNKIGAIVTEKRWNPAAVCGGGFHCWPWGIGIGGGKEPVFVDVVWQVISYLPEDVVWVDNEKAKCREVRIEYLGSWWEAYAKVESGKIAWIQHSAMASSSATGWSGSSSATGWSGSSSATGWRGSSSATGERGSSSATGESGSSSATGERGSSSATGESGSSSATGERGSSSATGERGSSSATGERGSSSATGERGSSSATGWSGSSSATGWSGSSSATGERGIAVTTGEYSEVECGPTGIAASTADIVTWIVVPGAVFVQHWTGKGGGVRYFKAKSTAKLGERITFNCGKIIKRVKP